MSTRYILTIDQGTTSSRALVFDSSQHKIITQVQREFTQHYPQNGWVEHNGEEIWETTLAVSRTALSRAEALGVTLKQIAGIGITNQRETTLVWEKTTGKLVYPAIVWQDRRTAAYCAELKAAGCETELHHKTGLYLDPYFCASKIAWILEHVPTARVRAEAGELLFGTIDSFLNWRLTGGAGQKPRHVTDVTNAARTNLYNIITHSWDESLLELFKIPRTMLAEVLPSSAEFGTTAKQWFGAALPILGVAGDQQASLFGHGCTRAGMMKSTYGTGAFLLVHSGHKPLMSKHQLLTTAACHVNGAPPEYALEGSIFIAGAALKWLKENMKFFTNYAASSKLAASLPDNDKLYVVPSFNGLGAPYWNAEVRGAIFGITRATTQAHIVRATLEAMAFQTYDLITALREDGIIPTSLRVDGGLAASDWLLSFMANVLAIELSRPMLLETTALGAAYLAAIGAGIYKDRESIAQQQNAQDFKPQAAQLTAAKRSELLRHWQQAVKAVQTFATAS